MQQPGMQLQIERRESIAVHVLACLELNSGVAIWAAGGNEIVALVWQFRPKSEHPSLCILPAYVSRSSNSSFRALLALGPTPGGGFRGRGTPASTALGATALNALRQMPFRVPSDLGCISHVHVSNVQALENLAMPACTWMVIPGYGIYVDADGSGATDVHALLLSRALLAAAPTMHYA